MMFKELARTGVRIPEVGIGTYGYQGGPEPLRRGLEIGAVFKCRSPAVDLSEGNFYLVRDNGPEKNRSMRKRFVVGSDVESASRFGED